MRLAVTAGVMMALLLTGPALALDLRSFNCSTDLFLDDSRYPPEQDFVRRAGAMSLNIIDAGDVLVVETTMPGEETQSTPLPLTERSPERLVAGTEGEQTGYSVALDLSPAAVTGLLVYRTYEIDQRWHFSCPD